MCFPALSLLLHVFVFQLNPLLSDRKDCKRQLTQSKEDKRGRVRWKLSNEIHVTGHWINNSQNGGIQTVFLFSEEVFDDLSTTLKESRRPLPTKKKRFTFDIYRTVLADCCVKCLISLPRQQWICASVNAHHVFLPNCADPAGSNLKSCSDHRKCSGSQDKHRTVALPTSHKQRTSHKLSSNIGLWFAQLFFAP